MVEFRQFRASHAATSRSSNIMNGTIYNIKYEIIKYTSNTHKSVGSDVCVVLIPSSLRFRFTAAGSSKTSSMATTSTGATGCVTSTRPALWPNRTWWPARTAGTSTSTPSDRWSPARSCWCGTARSSPRGSAASRSTSNRVSARVPRGRNDLEVMRPNDTRRSRHSDICGP